MIKLDVPLKLPEITFEKIELGKDKDGVALYLNYITNAVTLLAGELYFFRLPVIEIIFTGSIQVLYVEQSKRIA
jgi:hypothetical protein